MNALMQMPQSEVKDLSFLSSNFKNTNLSLQNDFLEIFQTILSDTTLQPTNELNLSQNENQNNSISFLLGKLLNLSEDFETKEQAVSPFSDGLLYSDNTISQTPIQDLLTIALMLKNGENVTDFPTDSQALTTALSKPEVLTELKSATTIKQLLDIAKDNGIEVKNFQFFKEEAALNPMDKKVVEKIKSEDIFKLIDQQVEVKTGKNNTQISASTQPHQNTDPKSSLLQTVLATKEVIKPLTQINQKPQTITPPQVAKTTEEAAHGDVDTISIIETEEAPKHKSVSKIFDASLNAQKNSEAPQTPNLADHETASLEASEGELTESKESQDKPTITNDTKTQTIEKTKIPVDVKKTFSTFAEEFREKVDSYKPPLMKITMELKPAGLGEVDVTLLTRGNNLQVNINSNANTIALFSQNQTEFKNSLVNMGFSDLQMNFSEQGKKEQEGQNSKNRQSFESFEEQEAQDGFEMIVPRYV